MTDPLDATWRRLRPYALRSVAVGAAMALSLAPLGALFVVFAGGLSAELAFIVMLIGLEAVSGMLAGGVGLLLERRLGARVFLAAAGCAAIAGLAELVCVAQLLYVQGVALESSPAGGMDAVAEGLEDAWRHPSVTVAIALGMAAGVVLPMALVLALRAEKLPLAVQMFFGWLLTGAALLLGCLVLWVWSDSSGIIIYRLDTVVEDHPGDGAAFLTLVLAGVSLALRGVPLSLTLPITLRVADGFEPPAAPPPAAETDPA